MIENTYHLLQSGFPVDRSLPALSWHEENYSFSDLEQSAGRYANLLASLNVQKGDRVAVQVEKSPQNLFLYLACLKAGYIYLPLNTAYKQAEIDYFIGDAEPALVVCDPSALSQFQDISTRQSSPPQIYTMDEEGHGSLHSAAQDCQADYPIASCSGSDIAVILYTSGTTGKPKGAMISHGNLISNATTLHQAWGWQTGDIMLNALPIYHVHGLFLGCHLPLMNGSKIIFLPRFDVPVVIGQLPNATVYMGVPTHYTRLLSSDALTPLVCRNMRLFTSGSAPLLDKTFHEFEARTGHTILERYGMTETGMNTSNPLRGERRAGTVGFALSGVSTRIVDSAGQSVPIGATGELEVKGENVFPGYWRMPEKTATEFTADGFFKTGDLACIDEDNYISIVGRGKDLIITGGLNVYPKEIEMALDKIQGVRESAVIGLPDADFGEAVTAIVVPGNGSNTQDPSRIRESLGQVLANFKVPKHVFFVDELPRNSMGKVQKNLLREKFNLARHH